MTKEQFNKSLSQNEPPKGLTELQTALWHAAKGNWEAAHNIAQQHEGQQTFDRLHAYLHRAEGDEWNAGYWYRRANDKVHTGSLQEELELLINRWL